MTDREIMKALEICADYENCLSMDSVITYRGVPLQHLFRETIDFINRQKAEIERLEGILGTRCDVCPAVTTALSKFIKGLEQKFANNTDISAAGYQSLIADIDNLLKEMEGENNK